MRTRYIPRTLETALRRAARQFPAVVLTGPRQSGKTTLLRHLFGESHGFVTLDDPSERRLAEHEPALFLEEHPAPVVIDEIQYAPGLLPYIKMTVDRRRERVGQFLLTGSQQFTLMHGVSESLAGRAAILTLLSLSWAERLRRAGKEPRAEGARAARAPDRRSAARSIAARWIRGSFPELAAASKLDAGLWYASYVQTYLERDVRSLRQVGDLGEFHSFLLALAARNAQILSLSDVSRDLGVAVNTVKAWLRVLEASQQILLLRPYHRNLGKRLVKSPKVFFLETGLLCHLLALRDPEQALRGPAAGALAEAAVLAEVVRGFTHRGEQPRVYFWRTASGDEVDFVVEQGGRLHPIEVKLSKTPRPGHAAAIERFRALFPGDAAPGRVVCLAPWTVRLTSGCRAVPFEEFAAG